MIVTLKNTANNSKIYRTCAICKKKFLKDNLCRIQLYKDTLYIDNNNGIGRSVYFEKEEITKLKVDDFIKLIQNKLKSSLSEDNKNIIRNFFWRLLNEKE